METVVLTLLAGLDPADPASGRWLTMLAVALGTLVSEDLATIGAGLLAAAGRLDFASAVAASFTGIFVGDLLLYALGYHFGRPLLRHRWARWVVSARALDNAQRLFRRHGVWIVLATRFIPGTRTATYFSAGALHAPFLPLAGVFALACALWTPLLVGASCLAGRRLLELYEVYDALALPVLLAAGLLVYALIHYGIPLLSWRGRRRLRGKWMRAVQWEFWPWWQVNWLVVLYVLWLGFVRHRRPMLFTVTNPCMPHSGFIGESKSAILTAFADAGGALPRWRALPAGAPEERLQAFTAAMRELGLAFPVVLKPDEGQRGAGVKVVRDAAQAEAWLQATEGPAILQEFLPGEEFGVFYVRHPDWPRGRIISVTTKEQMRVAGNGRDTLDTLIHAHPRAIAQLQLFLDRFATQLERVPAAGETVVLGEIGNHAQGTIFRDGRHLVTPRLEERIDALARACPGFCFGRFDLKAPGEAALREGRGLRIIEVNGLTSESTHIYDPRHGLFHAWATLCRQWRLAFEIGAANAAAGHKPARPGAFLRDLLAAMHRQRTAARA